MVNKKPRVEVHGSDVVVILPHEEGNGAVVVPMHPSDARDLSHSLVSAAARVEGYRREVPPEPEWVHADRQWLEDRAVGVLFNEDQMDGLQVLAERRNLTVGQWVVAEVLDTVEYSNWLMDSEVADDAEGEHEHGDTEPAQPDPGGEVAGGQDEQDRGGDVQDHGQHDASEGM